MVLGVLPLFSQKGTPSQVLARQRWKTSKRIHPMDRPLVAQMTNEHFPMIAQLTNITLAFGLFAAIFVAPEIPQKWRIGVAALCVAVQAALICLSVSLLGAS